MTEDERHHHLEVWNTNPNDQPELDADATCVIDQDAVLRALRESMPRHGIGVPHRGTGAVAVAGSSLHTERFESLSTERARDVLGLTHEETPWHTDVDEEVQLPTRQMRGGLALLVLLGSLVVLGFLCVGYGADLGMSDPLAARWTR